MVSKAGEAAPVSEAERAAAIDGLSWFTQQGGQIDASKIPNEKPIANSFFIDQRSFAWVARDEGEEASRAFEVFNPTGQYLGTVVAPFRLQVSPAPIVQGDFLYGVVRDDFQVPYLIRARLTRPDVAPS